MKKQARKRIIHNMVVLLETYPMDDITIKMICAYSDINRSTFYAYFEDKYELVNTIKNIHLDRYRKLMRFVYFNFDIFRNNPDKVTQLYRIVFKYLKRYQTFFKAIIVTHPNEALIRSYMKLSHRGYHKILSDLTNIKHVDYQVQFNLGGQMAIIYTWLKNDTKESPEEMAQLLYQRLTTRKPN
ncbi:TetR/AcrR family transcriptional regulator [Staphylococcus massiliensis]|uniref:Putative transcriptional regulator n=1 Tax=Staphylococcus massiliensis S46 TaxID=1229783 RepID=K9B2L8_9STAP|nr:TetR/AcrR family transcriptional regulator [Staphylococcus massiliensis]EKU49047.1 putative transcriptional regulator [Staphylococcus massiliensis S46]MCG3399488.1 TetR/AcrR family transcriptional regulator [Staphylococcus massiliensis]MCG3402412.1 TetR/AcrR family transcriptional regulator [Staphylococcus massiliensis]MCG3411624.1 TetR/AcrR family transcriptional regulator [Staphylococcus massiliensis]POA01466.1 TetR/AcrR family transcriptional regulator [Staphylococcus massiliensis CCUG 5